jgi:hypothetical protein
MRRICAEIGYFADERQPDGRYMDVLHVTAYVSEEDIRPQEE